MSSTYEPTGGICTIDALNLCSEIVLPGFTGIPYTQVWMNANMGGVDYEEALELLKQHYPEKFI